MWSQTSTLLNKAQLRGCEELERNVFELDLAKNEIESWNEVKKRLGLLNLSHNPLSIKTREEEEEDSAAPTIEYFSVESCSKYENCAS